jgi:predicted transcriptional regulator
MSARIKGMATLREISDLLGGEILTPGMDLEIECARIFASDLMSDVLAFMDPGAVLLTGLINFHVVRTARLAEAAAIVIVQGKRPDGDVVTEAGRHRVPVISTGFSMFDSCAKLSRAFDGGFR